MEKLRTKFQMVNKLGKKTADNYSTPEYAIDLILPYLNKNIVIWEPASGKGNISKKLIKHGFNVISSDINQQKDFLLWRPDNFDIIITNPPYSLKNKFIERCYELDKPFALLIPITSLEGEGRQKFFREKGIQLIIPNKRIAFETEEGIQTKTTWFATAWFCWKLNLPKDLNFVILNK